MKRHPLNIFSLIFGVFLILAATWAAFAPRGWWVRTWNWWSDTPQWRWLLPAAVIILGAALMSPLFNTKRSSSTPTDEAEGHAPVDATDPPPDHR